MRLQLGQETQLKKTGEGHMHMETGILTFYFHFFFLDDEEPSDLPLTPGSSDNHR